MGSLLAGAAAAERPAGEGRGTSERAAYLAGDLAAFEITAAAARPAPTAAPDAAVAEPLSHEGTPAFLFPGQGSQAVGMLKEAQDIPAVKAMLETARRVLGYDLLAMCLNGPKEQLDDTRHSQPALYVAGLAAVELLRSRDPAALAQCTAVAGLSLGEYTALVFAGVMSFEDGLRVVKARAESMAAAAAANTQGRPHGMLSIVGLLDEDVTALCTGALVGAAPGSVCQLANYLFPQGRVLSGHLEVLEVVRQAALA
ncbi:MAG: hypothetical protein WDW38_006892 [Sanguina aurantia]